MMPKIEPGTRVGALISYDDKTRECEFLGYGVFEGCFEIDDTACGDVAQMARDTITAARILIRKQPELWEELKDVFDDYIKNPVISLDNGGRVWGCECWWDLEEVVRENLKDAKIHLVSIENVRKALCRKAKDSEGHGG